MRLTFLDICPQQLSSRKSGQEVEKLYDLHLMLSLQLCIVPTRQRMTNQLYTQERVELFRKVSIHIIMTMKTDVPLTHIIVILTSKFPVVVLVEYCSL
jgi:hypothetical protein